MSVKNPVIANWDAAGYNVVWITGDGSESWLVVTNYSA